ncbi:MAG: DUF6452 family protein [Prevotellaceae bacterium]|nr:DUF6452 family protein [Prevotellaceae bacterium]
MKRRIKHLIPFAVVVMMTIITACSSIDCPLNNTVYTNYKLMKANMTPDTLRDTLYVLTARPMTTDSLLINRNLNTTSLKLPISYTNDEDVLYFYIKPAEGRSTIDTIRIAKTNTPHFESVDCAASYFHEITNVTTTHNRIDSVVVKDKIVNYDAKDNFYIYFKARN